jgi:Fuc2NAc and GlcNAc transferase
MATALYATASLAKDDAMKVLIISSVFLLSLIGVGLYRRIAVAYHLLDHPNHRSSHQVPTPRGAGIVFVLLWLLQVLVLSLTHQLPVADALPFLPTVLIAAIAFIDDYRSLSAKLRLLVQLTAALGALWLLGGVNDWYLGGYTLHLGGVIGTMVATVLLLWSTNLFNFMDGIDGIAGVEAMSVLVPTAVWVQLSGGSNLSLLIFSLAAAVLGFLCWNWPKAKIFMGDSGSSSLGFLVMLFALIAQQRYEIPMICSLILYGLFIFDASVTLLRRILAKHNWAEAHCLHAYQRLHQAGWSHRQVLTGVIAINVLLTIIAVIIYSHPATSLAGSVAALGLLTGSYYLVERKRPMFK